MGLFRKIAGLLGLAKDDGEADGVDNHHHHHQPHETAPFRGTGLPRQGFAVPVQIAVDRPHLAPILSPSTSGDGGVQGLKWYAKRLRIDEDGDVADEFFDEASPETSADAAVDQRKAVARFTLKYSTVPAIVKTQVLSHGKLKQRVEHQGRLQWV